MGDWDSERERRALEGARALRENRPTTSSFAAGSEVAHSSVAAAAPATAYRPDENGDNDGDDGDDGDFMSILALARSYPSFSMDGRQIPAPIPARDLNLLRVWDSANRHRNSDKRDTGGTPGHSIFTQSARESSSTASSTVAFGPGMGTDGSRSYQPASAPTVVAAITPAYGDGQSAPTAAPCEEASAAEGRSDSDRQTAVDPAACQSAAAVAMMTPVHGPPDVVVPVAPAPAAAGGRSSTAAHAVSLILSLTPDEDSFEGDADDTSGAGQAGQGATGALGDVDSGGAAHCVAIGEHDAAHQGGYQLEGDQSLTAGAAAFAGGTAQPSLYHTDIALDGAQMTPVPEVGALGAAGHTLHLSLGDGDEDGSVPPAAAATAAGVADDATPLSLTSVASSPAVSGRSSGSLRDKVSRRTGSTSDAAARAQLGRASSAASSAPSQSGRVTRSSSAAGGAQPPAGSGATSVPSARATRASALPSPNAIAASAAAVSDPIAPTGVCDTSSSSSLQQEQLHQSLDVSWDLYGSAATPGKDTSLSDSAAAALAVGSSRLDSGDAAPVTRLPGIAEPQCDADGPVEQVALASSGLPAEFSPALPSAFGVVGVGGLLIPTDSDAGAYAASQEAIEAPSIDAVDHKAAAAIAAGAVEEAALAPSAGAVAAGLRTSLRFPGARAGSQAAGGRGTASSGGSGSADSASQGGGGGDGNGCDIDIYDGWSQGMASQTPVLAKPRAPGAGPRGVTAWSIIQGPGPAATNATGPGPAASSRVPGPAVDVAAAAPVRVPYPPPPRYAPQPQRPLHAGNQAPSRLPALIKPAAPVPSRPAAPAAASSTNSGAAAGSIAGGGGGFAGFSTGTGKAVSLSEEAMARARAIFSGADTDTGSSVPSSSSFAPVSAASMAGRGGGGASKAGAAARALLKDQRPFKPPTRMQSSAAAPSAAGAPVAEAPDGSMAPAATTAEAAASTNLHEFSASAPALDQTFATAVAASARAAASSLPSAPSRASSTDEGVALGGALPSGGGGFAGFSTGMGKAVALSAEAMARARAIFSGADADVATAGSSTPSSSSFTPVSAASMGVKSSGGGASGSSAAARALLKDQRPFKPPTRLQAPTASAVHPDSAAAPASAAMALPTVSSAGAMAPVIAQDASARASSPEQKKVGDAADSDSGLNRSSFSSAYSSHPAQAAAQTALSTHSHPSPNDDDAALGGSPPPNVESAALGGVPTSRSGNSGGSDHTGGFSGFMTGSGKTVSLSAAALAKARRILGGDTGEEAAVAEAGKPVAGPAVAGRAPALTSGLGGPSRDGGVGPSTVDSGIGGGMALAPFAPASVSGGFGGFTTGGGRAVQLSAAALAKGRRILGEVGAEEGEEGKPQDGTPATSTGGGPAFAASERLGPVVPFTNDPRLDPEGGHGPSTAAGTGSSTGDTGGAFAGFSTGRGKSVSVSAAAMAKARALFAAAGDGSDIQGAPAPAASDAPGRASGVSTSSNSSMSDASSVPRGSGGGGFSFTTGKGKAVAVSAEAVRRRLAAAEATSEGADALAPASPFPAPSSGVSSSVGVGGGGGFSFSTGSGKSVGVSASALESARKRLDAGDDAAAAPAFTDAPPVRSVTFAPLASSNTEAPLAAPRPALAQASGLGNRRASFGAQPLPPPPPAPHASGTGALLVNGRKSPGVGMQRKSPGPAGRSPAMGIAPSLQSKRKSLGGRAGPRGFAPTTGAGGAGGSSHKDASAPGSVRLASQPPVFALRGTGGDSAEPEPRWGLREAFASGYRPGPYPFRLAPLPSSSGAMASYFLPVEASLRLIGPLNAIVVAFNSEGRPRLPVSAPPPSPASYSAPGFGVSQARSVLIERGCSPSAASVAWVANHWRWIVSKLAQTEARGSLLPSAPFTGYCTADRVVGQLLYRYERELRGSVRPALRRIFEGDGASSQHMVLAVAAIEVDGAFLPALPAHLSAPSSAPSHQPLAAAPSSSSSSAASIRLELTDGWHSVGGLLGDAHIGALVLSGRLRVGDRIRVAGAELVAAPARSATTAAAAGAPSTSSTGGGATTGYSSADPSDPLECFHNSPARWGPLLRSPVSLASSSSISGSSSGAAGSDDSDAPNPPRYLSLRYNGVRPAPWDAKLGFQRSGTFPVTLSGLLPGGGPAPCLQVVLYRRNVGRFLVTLPNGTRQTMDAVEAGMLQEGVRHKRQEEMEREQSALQADFAAKTAAIERRLSGKAPPSSSGRGDDDGGGGEGWDGQIGLYDPDGELEDARANFEYDVRKLRERFAALDDSRGGSGGGGGEGDGDGGPGVSSVPVSVTAGFRAVSLCTLQLLDASVLRPMEGAPGPASESAPGAATASSSSSSSTPLAPLRNPVGCSLTLWRSSEEALQQMEEGRVYTLLNAQVNDTPPPKAETAAAPPVPPGCFGHTLVPVRLGSGKTTVFAPIGPRFAPEALLEALELYTPSLTPANRTAALRALRAVGAGFVPRQRWFIAHLGAAGIACAQLSARAQAAYRLISSTAPLPATPDDLLASSVSMVVAKTPSSNRVGAVTAKTPSSNRVSGHKRKASAPAAGRASPPLRPGFPAVAAWSGATATDQSVRVDAAPLTAALLADGTNAAADAIAAAPMDATAQPRTALAVSPAEVRETVTDVVSHPSMLPSSSAEGEKVPSPLQQLNSSSSSASSVSTNSTLDTSTGRSATGVPAAPAAAPAVSTSSHGSDGPGTAAEEVFAVPTAVHKTPRASATPAGKASAASASGQKRSRSRSAPGSASRASRRHRQAPESAEPSSEAPAASSSPFADRCDLTTTLAAVDVAPPAAATAISSAVMHLALTHAAPAEPAPSAGPLVPVASLPRIDSPHALVDVAGVVLHVTQPVSNSGTGSTGAARFAGAAHVGWNSGGGGGGSGPEQVVHWSVYLLDESGGVVCVALSTPASLRAVLTGQGSAALQSFAALSGGASPAIPLSGAFTAGTVVAVTDLRYRAYDSAQRLHHASWTDGSVALHKAGTDVALHRHVNAARLACTAWHRGGFAAPAVVEVANLPLAAFVPAPDSFSDAGAPDALRALQPQHRAGTLRIVFSACAAGCTLADHVADVARDFDPEAEAQDGSSGFAESFPVPSLPHLDLRPAGSAPLPVPRLANLSNNVTTQPFGSSAIASVGLGPSYSGSWGPDGVTHLGSTGAHPAAPALQAHSSGFPNGGRPLPGSDFDDGYDWDAICDPTSSVRVDADGYDWDAICDPTMSGQSNLEAAAAERAASPPVQFERATSPHITHESALQPPSSSDRASSSGSGSQSAKRPRDTDVPSFAPSHLPRSAPVTVVKPARPTGAPPPRTPAAVIPSAFVAPATIGGSVPRSAPQAAPKTPGDPHTGVLTGVIDCGVLTVPGGKPLPTAPETALAPVPLTLVPSILRPPSAAAASDSSDAGSGFSSGLEPLLDSHHQLWGPTSFCLGVPGDAATCAALPQIPPALACLGGRDGCGHGTAERSGDGLRAVLDSTLFPLMRAPAAPADELKSRFPLALQLVLRQTPPAHAPASSATTQQQRGPAAASTTLHVLNLSPPKAAAVLEAVLAAAREASVPVPVDPYNRLEAALLLPHLRALLEGTPLPAPAAPLSPADLLRLARLRRLVCDPHVVSPSLPLPLRVLAATLAFSHVTQESRTPPALVSAREWELIVAPAAARAPPAGSVFASEHGVSFRRCASAGVRTGSSLATVQTALASFGPRMTPATAVSNYLHDEFEDAKEGVAAELLGHGPAGASVGVGAAASGATARGGRRTGAQLGVAAYAHGVVSDPLDVVSNAIASAAEATADCSVCRALYPIERRLLLSPEQWGQLCGALQAILHGQQLTARVTPQSKPAPNPPAASQPSTPKTTTDASAGAAQPQSHTATEAASAKRQRGAAYLDRVIGHCDDDFLPRRAPVPAPVASAAARGGAHAAAVAPAAPQAALPAVTVRRWHVLSCSLQAAAPQPGR